MPKRDAALLVGDIRTCLAHVAEYIRGMDLHAFLQDRKTIDAVTRNLEIIGEAARNSTIPTARLTPTSLGRRSSACATVSCTTTSASTPN